jgi:DNA topoisomerase I
MDAHRAPNADRGNHNGSRRAERSSPMLEIAAKLKPAAAAAGLVYVSDTLPGIRRVRRGSKFAYVHPDGRRVTDAEELLRIRSLAIPPAYEDVWICRNPRGHLQATGRDARGRKQYRYHPRWRTFRDSEKFERMTAFGEALPKLRRRLRRDLATAGLPREKVLAVVVSLLDATRIRIGNAEYVRENESYGLATLRNRHVRFVSEAKLVLRFRGKGGTEHEVAVDDRRLTQLVRRCHQLPGQRLFQYVDDDGQCRPVDSGDVNQYLKETMGADFTAKDFRTWGATLRAAMILHATPLPDPPSERALNACIVDAVRKIAAELRNTPAVCRKSYINPLVFEAWRSSALHDGIREDIAGDPRKAERLFLRFLKREIYGGRLVKRVATAERRAAKRRARLEAAASTAAAAAGTA